MALTATATTKVREDICANLKLRRPLKTFTGFDRSRAKLLNNSIAFYDIFLCFVILRINIFMTDRPNLYLSVTEKRGKIVEDLKTLMIRNGASFDFEGATIIYCPTKKIAEEVDRQLKSEGSCVKCNQKNYVVMFTPKYRDRSRHVSWRGTWRCCRY